MFRQLMIDAKNAKILSIFSTHSVYGLLKEAFNYYVTEICIKKGLCSDANNI